MGDGEGQATPRSRKRMRAAALTVAVAVVAAAAIVVGSLSGPATGAPAGAVDTLPPTPTSTSISTPTRTPWTSPPASPRPAPSSVPVPVVVPVFDRSARSIDDPASLWTVVDKARPLNPVDYVPPDLVELPVPHVWETNRLRREASDAVVGMFGAFTAETGLQLQSQSSYRSFATQNKVYNNVIAANGQTFADTSTARPGTSEHQTGLALDISALPGECSIDPCFGATPHGQWLAQNAWRFGFLLRYPADKVQVTGYGYEPWHFRYIGPDLATEMRRTGVTTLEEFFGLPAAPGYP